LVFELFNGNQYLEGQVNGPSQGNSLENTQLTRNHFKRYKMVVSLASFGMQRTDENQFKYHQYMKTTNELKTISDSLNRGVGAAKKEFVDRSKSYYTYTFRDNTPIQNKTLPKFGKWVDSLQKIQSKQVAPHVKQQIVETAHSSANSVLSYISSQKIFLSDKAQHHRDFVVELHHKFSMSFSCLVMFLIGASLGAIIKKGGFGLPILVGVLCFILSYVIMIQGDKWAKEGIVWLPLGVWLSNIILLVLGAYFVDRAVKDSRVFDKDVYIIFWNKLKKRIAR
jgi:lipopolysaccharide export system permease protein